MPLYQPLVKLDRALAITVLRRRFGFREKPVRITADLHLARRVILRLFSGFEDHWSGTSLR
jgi:hypothetical protein